MKNMYFKYILIYLFFIRDTYVYCKLKLQSTVQYCQNFNVGKVFLMFLKENFMQATFIRLQIKTVRLCNIITIWNNSFVWIYLCNFLFKY